MKLIQDHMDATSVKETVKHLTLTSNSNIVSIEHQQYVFLPGNIAN